MIPIGCCFGGLVYAVYRPSTYEHNHEAETKKSENYTPLSQEVVDYIKGSGHSVTEVCAGSGENAIRLRENGIIVHAYDMKSIKDIVEYGVCGTVEHRHPEDQILLICSGFDCVRSIQNFQGSILIIGGYIIRKPSPNKENIISLTEPIPIPASHEEEYIFILQLRPTFHMITSLGWKFEQAFFRHRDKFGSDSGISEAFYIFTR